MGVKSVILKEMNMERIRVLQEHKKELERKSILIFMKKMKS